MITRARAKQMTFAMMLSKAIAKKSITVIMTRFTRITMIAQSTLINMGTRFEEAAFTVPSKMISKMNSGAFLITSAKVQSLFVPVVFWRTVLEMHLPENMNLCSALTKGPWRTVLKLLKRP